MAPVAGCSPALSAAGLLLPTTDFGSCKVSSCMAQTMMAQTMVEAVVVDCAALSGPLGLPGKGYALAGLNGGRWLWRSTGRWAD